MEVMERVSHFFKTDALMAVAITLAAALSACTTESVKRGAYEAVYQKQCVEETRAPNCDPEHKSYDEYQKEREDFLKRERY
jgi:hypothetical protein